MKLLMFPGQGSQYPGMGKDWCAQFTEAKLAFEEASDGSGLDLKKLCFDGSEDDLKQTEITQPAILTASIAVFRSLCANTALGETAKTALYAGHSLGEWSAIVAAGALDLASAARLVRHRGAYMQAAVPAGVGAMAALIFKPKTEGNWERTAELCAVMAKASGRKISPANYNSPEQIVVAGEAAAVNMAVEKATQEPWGARKAVPLPVSAPFHCDLMKPAAVKLEPEIRAAAWKSAAGRRYVANVDASLHDFDAKGVQDRLVQQITAPVLWVSSVQAALAAGATGGFEIGPGAVLAGLAKRITREGASLEVRSIDRWEEFKNAGAVV